MVKQEAGRFTIPAAIFARRRGLNNNSRQFSLEDEDLNNNGRQSHKRSHNKPIFYFRCLFFNLYL